MTAAAASDAEQGRVWLALTGDVVAQRQLDRLPPALRSLLQRAELTFVNLEAPLTHAPVRAEKAATQRAHPERAKDLVDLGVDVVTLANNHLMDCGEQGYRDTLDALVDAGIAAVGAGNDAKAALQPALLSTSQGTLATLALCAALPPGFAATTERPGVAGLRVHQQVAIDPALAAEQPGMAPFVHTRAVEADLQAACAAVASARELAEWIIVGVHWGVPEGFAPRSYGVLAQYQRPMAHRLVDAGADLVVGHHPHVVHPLEVYRGKLIAFSLGNFVFHNWTALSRASTTAADATGDVDPGHLFASEVPAAPYQNPFAGTATTQSVVLCARRDGERLHYRLVPTVMIDGDPVIADVKAAADTLARLCEPPLTDWHGGVQATVEMVEDRTLGTTVGVVTP